MGLIMPLPKENNPLYYDFPQAYWSIDEIVMGKIGADEPIVRFTFTAYPSREAKGMTNQMIPNIGFGGASVSLYQSALYRWTGQFRAFNIFPDGMPITESAQKAILYPFVKSFLGLTNAVDVLEDES